MITNRLIQLVCLCLLLVLLAWPSVSNGQEVTTAQPASLELEIPSPGAPGNIKSVTLKLRICPDGKVIPGDPEKKRSSVDITRFAIGETEITVKQFKEVMGNQVYDRFLTTLNQNYLAAEADAKVLDTVIENTDKLYNAAKESKDKAEISKLRAQLTTSSSSAITKVSAAVGRQLALFHDKIVSLPAQLTTTEIDPLLDQIKRIRIPITSTLIALKSAIDHFQEINSAKRSEDEPMFALSIVDIVAFCNKARQYQKGAKDASDPLLILQEKSIRIPTWWEWQYACQARQLPNAKGALQFPPALAKSLPTVDKLDDNQKADCEKLWKNQGIEDESKFGKTWKEMSPEQFQARLLHLDRAISPDDGTESRTQLRKILDQYFSLAFGWVNDGSVRLSRYPVTTPATPPNQWHLVGMLDNVTEWTLWQDQNRDPMVTWAMLENGSFASLQSSALFFLAGGASTGQPFNNQGDLRKRTYWGGVLVDDQPSPIPFNADNQISILAYAPGFRIVVNTTLNPAWILARKVWFSDGKFNPDAKDWLSKAREKVKDLPNNKDVLAVIDLDEKRLSGASDAVATLQTTDAPSSARRLLERRKNRSDDD